MGTPWAIFAVVVLAAAQLGAAVGSDSDGVPKIVHQTHRSRADWSRVAGPHQERFRELLPDWELRFYDDAAMVAFVRKVATPRQAAAFGALQYGAARADLFRYLVMLHVGGLYLDAKSFPVGVIDDSVAPPNVSSVVLSHWVERYWARELPPDGEFQQWYLLGSAGHPLWQSVLSDVVENVERCPPGAAGWISTLETTGPIAFARAVLPRLDGWGDVQVVEPNLGGRLVYAADESQDKDGKVPHEAADAQHYRFRADPLVRWGSSRKERLVRALKIGLGGAVLIMVAIGMGVAMWPSSAFTAHGPRKPSAD